MTGSEVLSYLMNLQGVANDTAKRMLVFLSEADVATIKFLQEEMADFDLSDPRKAAKRLREIEAAINEIRSAAFKKMKDDFLLTAGEVTDEIAVIAGKEIEAQYGQAAKLYTDIPEDLAVRRKMFNPNLTKTQRNEILQFMNFKSGRDDAGTIGDWFSNWGKNDLQRIMGMVKRASVEQMELGDMIRRLRGWTDRQGIHHDGVLDASHESARRVARTLINGVANAGKMEIYRQNADVIDGVKWLATLDSRTCMVCANLDGRIWPPTELDKVSHPPAHFNCRCALIPYIDLGPEFEIERAAEVKNFELEAEERYNAKQEVKGSDKRWSDLTYDYRKQLRYKEMRDWSKANDGASPYKQVKSSDTFKEYFETLPVKSQREWLGQRRYFEYSLGNLDSDQLVNPDDGFVRSIKDLQDSGIIPNRKPVETAAEFIADMGVPQERLDAVKEAKEAANRLRDGKPEGDEKNRLKKLVIVELKKVDLPEQRLAGLERLFPDNGHDEIFNESLFDQAKKQLVHIEQGANNIVRKNFDVAVKSATDFWNRVSKSIDIDPVDFPKINIVDNLKGGRNSEYNPIDNEIKISASIVRNSPPDAISKSIVHEMGHWFEHIHSNTHQRNKKWLLSNVVIENGQPVIIHAPSFDYYKTRDTTLTMREYGRNSNDNEVFSTGIERLFSSPVCMAVETPEHFEETLKSIWKGKKQ